MRYRVSVVSGLMLIMTSGASVHPQSLEESVRVIAQSFHEALSRGDSTAALTILHPEVLVFEGGRSETKEQYSRAHLRADIALASAVRRETLSDAVLVHKDVAVYARDYRARGQYRDREVDFTASETFAGARRMAHPAHPLIEHENIGVMLDDRLDGQLAGRAVRDNGDVGLGAEECLQALQNNCVIIDDHQTNHRGRRRSSFFPERHFWIREFHWTEP